MLYLNFTPLIKIFKTFIPLLFVFLNFEFSNIVQKESLILWIVNLVLVVKNHVCEMVDSLLQKWFQRSGVFNRFLIKLWDQLLVSSHLRSWVPFRLESFRDKESIRIKTFLKLVCMSLMLFYQIFDLKKQCLKLDAKSRLLRVIFLG